MANYDFKNDFPAPYFIPQHSSKFVNRLYDINCIEDSSLQYRFNNSINTHCDFDSQSKPYLGKNIEDNALHDSDDFYENSSSNNINNHSGHHSSIQYDSCHGSIGSSFDGYANYSVNNSAGNYMGNSIRSHGSVNNSVDSSTVDNSDIKYVGLQNQGATCYMNSMLQAFFHLPAFRKLVYKMPTEGVEDETKNIPLNLQKLFTKMQCSKTSCSTTALTKSFGWNDADTFTQHDVQEFCRVLVDNLETKMKKSELDGEIAKILRGKYNRYIRCVNVDFETSKIEEFYDLSMVVKDTFNLEESFKKYIEPELLSGDNQYQTDKHGKQDVNVGIEFLEFPSVLHLHLRRFEFNFYTEQMVKINSRFEFPPTIDLSPYLAPNADRSKSSIFDLYGVLVHSGSVNFGHYYAFLRTSTSEQWYQFNDSNVSRATYEQAVTNNFGGSNSCMSNYNHNGGSYDIGYGMSYEKSFSAYMLIYIRRDDAPRLMKPVQKEDIPPHLLDCLKEDDNHTYGYYKQTKSEVTIKVIHEDSILVNSIKNTTGYKCGPLVKNFKFNSKTTNAELYEKVADEFKLDKNEIRLYLTYSKFSPYRIIQCDDASIDTYYTSLFLQKKPKEEQLEITDHILLLKFFHISLEVPIQYIGYLSVKPSSTVSDISPKISQILGFPEDTEYEIFTMGYQDELKPLGNDSTLENYSYSIYQIFIQLKKNSPINISSATFKWHTKQEIIQKYGESIFDKKSTKKTQTKKDGNEKKDEVNNSKLKKIIYKDTTNKSITSITKYMKRFKQLTKAILYLLDEPNTPIYEIEFPAAAITAIQLQNFLVKNLNLDFNEEKDTLLISKCLNNNSTSQPVVIMAQPNETVERDFHTYMKSKFNIYVHLVKNVTKDELENMISITLFISTDGFNVSLKKTIFLPKKSFIKDLRTKVEEMIDEKIIKYDMVDNKTPEIRISSVNQNQISSICEMDEKISFLNHTFRVDLVPNCQLDLSNNEYLTTGTFMKNNEYHHCSAIKDPFYFVVNKTEKVSELKNRLKEILHLENSLSRCKVYFKSTSTYNIKDNILLKDNDEIVGDLIGNKELELIILYPPEKSKISRDESLKIYN